MVSNETHQIFFAYLGAGDFDTSTLEDSWLITNEANNQTTLKS